MPLVNFTPEDYSGPQVKSPAPEQPQMGGDIRPSLGFTSDDYELYAPDRDQILTIDAEIRTNQQFAAMKEHPDHLRSILHQDLSSRPPAVRKRLFEVTGNPMYQMHGDVMTSRTRLHQAEERSAEEAMGEIGKKRRESYYKKVARVPGGKYIAPVFSGVEQSGLSMVGTLFAKPGEYWFGIEGGHKAADALNREIGRIGQSRRDIVGDSMVQNTIEGVSRTITDAITSRALSGGAGSEIVGWAGRVARTIPMAISSSSKAINQAVTDGTDAGLTPDEITRLAMVEGATEAFATLVSSAIPFGEGGIETGMMKKAMASAGGKSLKKVIRDGLKDVSKELVEELVIAGITKANRKKMGLEPDEWTDQDTDEFIQIVVETVATLGTMKSIDTGTKRLAKRVSGKAKPAADTSTDIDTMEELSANAKEIFAGASQELETAGLDPERAGLASRKWIEAKGAWIEGGKQGDSPSLGDVATAVLEGNITEDTRFTPPEASVEPPSGPARPEGGAPLAQGPVTLDEAMRQKPAVQVSEKSQQLFDRINKDLHGKATIVPAEPTAFEGSDEIRSFIEDRGGEVAYFDGDISADGVRLGDTILLRSGATEADLARSTAAHEVAHMLELDKKYADELESLGLRQEMRDSYDKRLGDSPSAEAIRKQLGDEGLNLEATADFIGNLMKDEGFRARIAKENPGVISKVVQFFKDMIAKDGGKSKLITKIANDFIAAAEGRKAPGKKAIVKEKKAVDKKLARMKKPVATGEVLQKELQREIAKRRTAEADARTDATTGLGNKMAYDESISDAKLIADEGGQPFSVIQIDLANFKQVNDTHGHEAGDELLAKIGEQIRSVQGDRPLDTMFRQGGDEFAVVLPATDRKGAEAVRDRIEQAVGTTEIVPGLSSFAAGEVATYSGDQAAFNADMQSADEGISDRKTAKKQEMGEAVGREAAAKVVKKAQAKPKKVAKKAPGKKDADKTVADRRAEKPKAPTKVQVQAASQLAMEAETMRGHGYSDEDIADAFSDKTGADITPEIVNALIEGRPVEGFQYSPSEQPVRISGSDAMARLANVLAESPKVTGRPELANLSEDEKARRMVDLVDELRKEQGLPTRKMIATTKAEATKLLAKPEGRADLVAKVDSGAMLDSTETVAARKVYNELADKAFQSGAEADTLAAVQFADGIRKGRSEWGRTGRNMRDPSKSPRERMAEFAINSIFTMPENKQVKVDKSEAVIANPDSTPAQKVAAQEDITTLQKWWADQIDVLKGELMKKGIAPSSLTAENLQDYRLALKVLKTSAPMRGDWQSKLHTYWLSALLSGWKTQMANLSGNSLHFAVDTVLTKSVQRTMNTVAKLATGKHIKGVPTWGELKYTARAFPRAVARGFSEMMQTAVTEIPMYDRMGIMATSTKDEVTMEKRFAIGGKLGRVVRAPLTFLGGVDDFFKATVMYTDVYGEAYRQAKQIGVASGEADAYVQAQVSDPKSEAWEHAVLEANRLTFQQALGGWGNLVLDIRGKSAKLTKNLPIPPANLNYTLPFIPTLLNIFKTAGRYTTGIGTIGVVTKIAKYGFSEAYRKSPAVERDIILNVAQQMVGLGFTYMLMGMMDDEDDLPRITGSEPWTPGARAKRDMAYRTIPPNSVRIPGTNTWVDYSRLEPIGTTLTMAVDSINAVKKLAAGKEDIGTVLEDTARKFGSALREKTFARGLSDAMRAWEEPRSALGYYRRFLASFTPNLVKQVSRELTPEIRENRVSGKDTSDYTQRQLAAMMYDAMPGFDFSNPPAKVDIYGRDVKKDGSFMERVLSPLKRKNLDRISKHDIMLRKWNAENPNDAYYPGEMKPYITLRDGARSTRIELDPDETYKMKKMAGRLFLEELDATHFESPPQEEDIMIYKDALAAAREYARNTVLDQYYEGQLKEKP